MPPFQQRLGRVVKSCANSASSVSVHHHKAFDDAGPSLRDADRGLSPTQRSVLSDKIS